jgi:pyruvate dehydrogenase E2 component (dihydrolipoamide acetyltransferase)
VLVSEGDTLKAGDPLLTLETEKAAVDVPSPFSGTIKTLFVKKGSKSKARDKICEISSDDRKVKETQKKQEQPKEESIKQEPTEEHLTETQFEGVEQDTDFINKSFKKVHASPSVRKLARELGVDLTLITGTGMKGRVKDEDLKVYVKSILSSKRSSQHASIPEVPEIDYGSFGEIEVVPLSRIKKISGPRLHASWLNIPHVTQHDEADINEIEQIRLNTKKAAAQKGIRLTLLSYIIKAACKVLMEFPEFNSSIKPNEENLTIKKYINIGFAADTPQGLLVPVIKNADQKDILTIATELGELSESAREKTIKLGDLQGGTFTISSLGGFGGTGFTPIINAPEVAILGVSKAQVKPVFLSGQFLPRLILPFSLSYDHRVADGVAGIRFTSRFKALLEDPETLLDSMDE